MEQVIDMSGFGVRLREAIAPEKPTHFAERIGVASPTLFKYLKPPPNFSPSLEIVARMALGAGTSIDYLATGRGETPSRDADLVLIPRYAATLAAGAGSWNEGRQKIEDVPFTRDFLNNQLGRSSASKLTIVESRGDSMMTTFGDGAALMIDEGDTNLVDGIFAFTLDGEARVKRFRQLVSGLMIISDNPSYPPEKVEGGDLKRIEIIGRLKWVGQTL